MPPIPVHIDDPITPTKTKEATAGTAAGAPPAPAPASEPATTTQPAYQAVYPPAQPGAAAVPAPTPYVPRAQPQPTRTTSVSGASDGPPAPQPGAVPVKPGQVQATPFAGALNHMYAPPPQAQNLQHNYTPTSSTIPAAPMPSGGGLRTVNLGPVSDRRISSEHPPGYVQNQYAQEMSPAQRASLDMEERSARSGSLPGGLGLGGGAGAGGGEFGGEGGVWETAKGWLSKAGAALAEGEKEVWRRIDGRGS